MFWTGCGADANPLPRGKIELCEQYGKELADAVVAAVKADEARQRQVRAEVREDHAASSSRCPRRSNSPPTLSARTSRCKRRAERLLKELEATARSRTPTRTTRCRRGRSAIRSCWVALGGEVVIDYALRLKKELPATRDALGDGLRERRDGVHSLGPRAEGGRVRGGLVADLLRHAGQVESGDRGR